MRLPVEGGVSEETDTSVGRIGESWRDFSHTKCRREHVVLFYFGSQVSSRPAEANMKKSTGRSFEGEILKAMDTGAGRTGAP